MIVNPKREKELVTLEDEWKMIFDIHTKFGKCMHFEGISIIIHTNEANHYGTPHCHAKYKNQEISISLRDFSILASTGMDSKHQRMAVDYVRNHADFLIETWNKNPNVLKL